MDPLADFQADLDRLAELDDAALADLEARITEAFAAADEAQDDTSMGQLADALDMVKAEMAQRTGGEEANPADAAAMPAAPPVMAASAETETPAAAPATEAPAAVTTETATPATPETPAEQPSTEAPAEAAAETPAEAQPSTENAPTTEQETPAVTASTVVVTEPQVPAEHAPVVTAPANTIVAGAGLQNITTGGEITSLDQLGQLMARRVEQISKAPGDGEPVLVASIRSDIPDSKFLKYGDPFGNLAKIQEVINPEAITAAGGCCAPLTTRYDLFGIGDTDRPVKASLAGFGADRGGIRYFEGPTLDSIGAAVGFWTCADDAAVDAADPDTWKVCARVDCPDESEALVQAVTLCLTFGVMQSRVFPEMVTANNKLSLVAQARLSESALLAQIKAGSKRVASGGTYPTGMSFVRQLLDTVSRAAAYYRDRHRLAPTTQLRAMFPVWMIEAVRSDVTFQAPSTAQMADNFGISVDELESFFRDRFINVAWTMDSPNPASNGGGFYSNVAQGGTLPAFPNTVEWSLSIEGSWLFLDGGQLDLGIIRDSQLVRTNDYQTFMETFESATRIGGESLWITSNVVPTGRAAGPVDYPATV